MSVVFINIRTTHQVDSQPIYVITKLFYNSTSALGHDLPAIKNTSKSYYFG